MKRIFFIIASLFMILKVAGQTAEGDRLFVYSGDEPIFTMVADAVDSIALEENGTRISIYSNGAAVFTSLRSQLDSIVTKSTYVLPCLKFGELASTALFEDWAFHNGATLKTDNAYPFLYRLCSDEVDRVGYTTDKNNLLQEAVVKVKDHNVTSSQGLQDYLLGSGFNMIDETHFYTESPQYVLADLSTDDNLYDMHFYGVVEEPNLYLPYTTIGEKISSDSLIDLLENCGYTYNALQSTAKLLRFEADNADFPFFYVGLNETTGRSEGVAIYAESKYVYRSPGIKTYFEENGFAELSTSTLLAPKFYNEENDLLAEVLFPAQPIEGRKEYIRIMRQNPPQDELTKIDFPVFNFGCTEEEVVAKEAERGRTAEIVAGTLNASTGDDNFPVHAYFFKDDLYSYSVTIVKNNDVIDDPNFETLMEEAGFEFLREDDEKNTISFWYTDYNGYDISALVQKANDSNDRPSITYRSFKK